MKYFFVCLFLISSLNFLIALPYLDKDRDGLPGHRDKMHTHRVEGRIGGARAGENDAQFWNDMAQNTLAEHLARVPIEGVAKNLIIFIGDGMSIPSITAARIFKGGEQSKLEWETFPYTGLSKTYCVNTMVPDSACSATAYIGGVKGNIATTGVTGAVANKDCDAMLIEANKVPSIIRKAQLAGKATGVVTTTRITHATPASSYAHTAERDWESDADVELDGQDTLKCDDIAEQLVYGETGKNINVLFGGGRGNFRDTNAIDEEGKDGYRHDGKDLIEEWKLQKQQLGSTYGYAWDSATLETIDIANTDYVLGLFEKSHFEYNLDDPSTTKPKLSVLTGKAIQNLQRYSNGFVLFVEGGLIDRAHHETWAQKAFDETLQLENAVKVALQMTNRSDTLIIVTADHAHTMSINGYPARGSTLFGIAGTSDVDTRPYSVISYANGPGYKDAENDGDRYNIKDDVMDDKDYTMPSLAPLTSETHGGDDVAVFAIGPWAHLFTGNFEENFIHHAMSYAGCLGTGLTACQAK